MTQRLRDFDALSFDCYGTLIDWEAGIGAVLVEWASRRGLNLDSESLLTAYASHEATAESEYPTAPYPEILARSMRELGDQLGVEVTDDDAQRAGLPTAWINRRHDRPGWGVTPEPSAPVAPD